MVTVKLYVSTKAHTVYTTTPQPLTPLHPLQSIWQQTLHSWSNSAVASPSFGPFHWSDDPADEFPACSSLRYQLTSPLSCASLASTLPLVLSVVSCLFAMAISPTATTMSAYAAPSHIIECAADATAQACTVSFAPSSLPPPHTVNLEVAPSIACTTRAPTDALVCGAWTTISMTRAAPFLFIAHDVNMSSSHYRFAATAHHQHTAHTALYDFDGAIIDGQIATNTQTETAQFVLTPRTGYSMADFALVSVSVTSADGATQHYRALPMNKRTFATENIYIKNDSAIAYQIQYVTRHQAKHRLPATSTLIRYKHVDSPVPSASSNASPSPAYDYIKLTNAPVASSHVSVAA